MMENVHKASRAGLPSTIHAIGDRAVHEVLNVYDNQLLAVVPVDKADEALVCGNATLRNLAVPYFD